MKNTCSINEYPIILTISDVADFLEISMPYAYMIVGRKDFPAINIRRRILIYKGSFKKWLHL